MPRIVSNWSGTASNFAAFLGKDVANSVLAQKPAETGTYQFVARDLSQFILKAFPGYWAALRPSRT